MDLVHSRPGELRMHLEEPPVREAAGRPRLRELMGKLWLRPRADDHLGATAMASHRVGLVS